jgi:hypothetical protein
MAATGQVEDTKSEPAREPEATPGPVTDQRPLTVKPDYRQAIARCRQTSQEQMRLF